jgi:hypothetical protein
MPISPGLPFLRIPMWITHTTLPIRQLIRDLSRADTSIIIKDDRTQPSRAPPTFLLRLPPRPNPLTQLPPFNPAKEEDRLDSNDRPLPGDTSVLEDVMVDDGNIQDDEDGDEAEDNGPEEELVAPDVEEELRVRAVSLGAHAEEGAAEVQEFPG